MKYASRVVREYAIHADSPCSTLLYMLVACNMMYAVSCSLGSPVKYDSVREPIEYAMLITSCLEKGDDGDLLKNIISGDDVQVIAIVRERTISDIETQAQFTLREQLDVKRAFMDATSMVGFANSRIVAFNQKERAIANVFLGMISIQPTEVVKGITFRVETGGAIATIETGELYKINGRWKLYGGFRVKKVD